MEFTVHTIGIDCRIPWRMVVEVEINDVPIGKVALRAKVGLPGNYDGNASTRSPQELASRGSCDPCVETPLDSLTSYVIPYLMNLISRLTQRVSLHSLKSVETPNNRRGPRNYESLIFVVLKIKQLSWKYPIRRPTRPCQMWDSVRVGHPHPRLIMETVKKLDLRIGAVDQKKKKCNYEGVLFPLGIPLLFG